MATANVDRATESILRFNKAVNEFLLACEKLEYQLTFFQDEVIVEASDPKAPSLFDKMLDEHEPTQPSLFDYWEESVRRKSSPPADDLGCDEYPMNDNTLFEKKLPK